MTAHTKQAIVSVPARATAADNPDKPANHRPDDLRSNLHVDDRTQRSRCRAIMAARVAVHAAEGSVPEIDGSVATIERNRHPPCFLEPNDAQAAGIAPAKAAVRR